VQLPLSQTSKNVMFFSFFFYKMEEQGSGTSSVGVGGIAISGQGSVAGKKE
jgi:hypothetical protein